ncbi:hypothetical protein J7337_005920 [Fusarium musae]|uniref:Beta-lactamase-related domain-containing protein n=1 Tax=Fusarium musae TaxID=1042133 RepID=A0A9P8DJV5_9HYPO|nr:hypothetical protein J7337_005920 [Fusarium musae]KAG9503082.1 hypothetical protein J7337_005920 [Fusarium musae]
MAERAYRPKMTVRLLQLTIPFFLPGVSKMFTAAAIDHLIKHGKLSIRTKVYKRIGYSAKGQRAMSIIVKHLLEHKGGYDGREASEDISVDFNKEYLSKLGSVAAVYWGYGAIMEECSAAFSLKASASTIAKFAGFHAVSGIGLRKNGSHRGDFEGARTHVESNEYFDFAVVLNTRDFASFDDLTENQVHLLQDDLMP